MPQSYSERGFAQYTGPVRTVRGDVVAVYESSSAEERACWVSLTGEAHLDGPPRPLSGTDHGVAPGWMAAHLSEEDARRVYDGLGEFLGLPPAPRPDAVPAPTPGTKGGRS